MKPPILHLWKILYYEVDETHTVEFMTRGFSLVDAINSLLDQYAINLSRVQIYSIEKIDDCDNDEELDLFQQCKEWNNEKA